MGEISDIFSKDVKEFRPTEIHIRRFCFRIHLSRRTGGQVRIEWERVKRDSKRALLSQQANTFKQKNFFRPTVEF
jgi:hypothetical protein